MKFTKRKDDESTIRKVWSNDKEVCYGIVGTVGDFLKAGILEYCDYPTDGWCFLPALGIVHEAKFGKSKEDAIADLPK